MPMTMQDFTNPGAAGTTSGFPDAPPGWSIEMAKDTARSMGLELTEDHWEAIRVLQGAYRDEASPPLRRLHDALDARFSARGGMKHLYELFGGGPVTRGCLLAGLTPPGGASDAGAGLEI